MKADVIKKIFLIVFVASTLFFVGCKSDEEDDKIEAPVALYNKNKESIAYIDYEDEDDNDLGTIYMYDGTPVAYLYESDINEGSNIYSFNGVFMGWYVNGIVYDREGYAVGAKQGILRMEINTNITQPEPPKITKGIKPVKFPRSAQPVCPLLNYYWSETSLSDFFLFSPEKFLLQWDSFIDNSAETTDIFIGTKYLGIQGWPLVANPPYIYIGATFPKNTFASSFDGEVKGNKQPLDLTFNFPAPYTTEMEEVKGTEYLKKLKEAMSSEEYKSYTPPARPYIAKLAKLNSLANLDSCFSENKNFGNTFELIAKQEIEMENVKSLSVGEIVFKGFTVSMEAPSNGLFVDTPTNLSDLVYIRTLTYGVTAYFVIASEHSYQDVLTAFKNDDYKNPEGILHKSQIILLTVSDVNQEAIIKSSFDDLKEFMNKPFYNKEAYGYPIFCKGFYAEDNQVFNGDN